MPNDKEVAEVPAALLPCPWCGATPLVFDHSIEGFKSEWSVYCEGEMCAVAPSTSGEFKQHATSQWNNQTVARRRTAPSISEQAQRAATELWRQGYLRDFPDKGTVTTIIEAELAHKGEDELEAEARNYASMFTDTNVGDD